MNDPFAGPGETLRAAREALQYSCREIAEALNLHVDTVVAIEANDHARLPVPAYTRGYIRAYAKLLELDADSLVADYRREEGAVERSDGPRGDIRSERGHISKWVYRIAGLVALAVLLGLVVWFWHATAERPIGQPDGAPSPPEQPSSTEVTESPQTNLDGSRTPERPLSVAEDLATGAERDRVLLRGDSGVTGAEVPGGTESTPGRADQRRGVNQPPASLSGAPATRSLRITRAGDDRLRLQFVDDCWLEVKSMSGAILYSDLSRRGAELELIGQAPFRILLGYSPGAELWFNDEAIALAPHTRNSVANLVLGQYQ